MKKKHGAVRTETYERLKKDIIEGRYAAGELVQISEFARDLGVSRTPVKEALSTAERDLLVDVINGRGAIIRPLSMDEIININQFREVVDGLAARLSARTIPEAVIASLRSDFESLLEESGAAESERHSQLSHTLHKTIAESCGNWVVQTQWKHLDTAFSRLKQKGWETWLNSTDKKEISLRRLNEHLEIIDAIEKRDPDRAEQAARKHIVRATKDLLQFLGGSH